MKASTQLDLFVPANFPYLNSVRYPAHFQVHGHNKVDMIYCLYCQIKRPFPACGQLSKKAKTTVFHQ
jgi:hypothetical protein